jgi:hypothetical protein
MRNNQRRTGQPAGSPSPASVQTGANLTYVVPTEFVELPSRGVFYPEGHPFFNQETAEIKYMTAKEEDILSSQALLKKGLIVDRLLGNLIVADVDPQSLLIGDKNALMIAARISGYGSEYNVGIKCSVCHHGNTIDYSLKEAEIVGKCFNEIFLKENNIVFNIERRVFELELPVSKVNISIYPITGFEEKEYLRPEASSGNSSVTSLLAAFIERVDETTDREQILQFIDNMPAADSKHLRNMYSSLVPNITLRELLTCEACVHQETVEVPLTAEFFWPK